MIEAMGVHPKVVEILVRNASWLEMARPAWKPVGATQARLPSTWCESSVIQLRSAKEIDTSDRTLFRRAGMAAFDPYGFQDNRGLQRPIFYKSGYLTCTRCNGLTFINAAALRSVLELKFLLNLEDQQQESLPPCARCGETSGLRVGAHDFLSLIEGKTYRSNLGTPDAPTAWHLDSLVSTPPCSSWSDNGPSESVYRVDPCRDLRPKDP